MSILLDVEHRDTPRPRADDMMLANRMADVLARHYPGHPWCVHVDSRGGIAAIWLPILNHRHAYVLHLSKVYGDPALRAVVRAGGEWLERYRIPRAGYDHAAYLDAQARTVSHGAIPV